jgi:hypothetical protein
MRLQRFLAASDNANARIVAHYGNHCLDVHDNTQPIVLDPDRTLEGEAARHNPAAVFGGLWPNPIVPAP